MLGTHYEAYRIQGNYEAYLYLLNYIFLHLNVKP